MAKESEGLTVAIEKCLAIDRATVERASMRWSWNTAWEIFKNNLVKKSN
jgi:hypothetical protein